MNKAQILRQLNWINTTIHYGELKKALDDFSALCATLKTHHPELKNYCQDVTAVAANFHNASQGKSNTANYLLEIIKSIETELVENQKIAADLTPSYPQSVHIEIVAIEETVQELARRLQESKHALPVLGVGGLGKTTLAQKYYNTYKQHYQHHAWIDIRDRDLMNTFVFNETLLSSLGIAAFDQGDKLEDKFKEVLRVLRSLPGEKLLVIDALNKELTEAESQLLKNLPKEAAYKILFTTRYKHNNFDTYQLPVPSPEQAKAIYRLYRAEAPAENGIDELLEFIGYHPLLIELIAKTIKESFYLSPEKVLERFKKNELQSIKTLVMPERDYQETTIQNRLKEIVDMAGLEADEKLFLMQLCVLLTLQPAPFKDLCFAFQLDEDKLEEKLTNLKKRGLISRVKESEGVKIAVHQAVGVAVKDHIKPTAGNCELLIDSFSDKLNDFIHENPVLEFSCTRYAPLLASLVTYLSTECTDKIANIFEHLSCFYRLLGTLEEALEVQKKAVEIRERVLDSNHPVLAGSYHNLSAIYQVLDRMEEALELQMKVLKIRERVLDSNDINIASSYNNLVGIYQALGRQKEAFHAQKKALEIFEQCLAPTHPNLATAYSNLSLIYRDLGKTEEALKVQMKALEIRQTILNSNHPDLATSYNNLSLIYFDLSRLKEAFDLSRLKEALETQEKALRIRQAILNSNHPDLATSYYNLSLIYLALGRREEALKVQISALEIRKQVLSSNHIDLANSYSGLSIICQSLWRLEEALGAQIKAVAIRERVLGSRHPDLAGAYYNLSNIYLAQNNIKDCIVYLLKSIEIWQVCYPNGHPHLTMALQTLEQVKRYLDTSE